MSRLICIISQLLTNQSHFSYVFNMICKPHRSISIFLPIILDAAFHDGCTILHQPVQVHGNTYGQCNDADDQRDSQLDNHEEQHRQATADADYVVHEAREYGKPTE